MPGSSADELRAVNQRLHVWLARYEAEHDCPSLACTEGLANLLADLAYAGEVVRHLPPGFAQDEQVRAEILHYRQNLEQLEEVLPRIHHVLLSERARLEAQRTHMEAVAGWTDSSKSTL